MIQAQTQSNLKPTPAKPRASLIPPATPVTTQSKSSNANAVIGRELLENTNVVPTTRPITRSMSNQALAERRAQNQNYFVEEDTQFVYDVTIISDPNKP